MIIAEFTYTQSRLTRVFDSITGFDLVLSKEVEAAAYQSQYGSVKHVTTKHNEVAVGYVIKESK